MEPSIYSYSLCIALPLMLFFGFYFLLAPTPEKPFSIIICVPGELWGSHTVTCRQLFGTFLFWNQVQEYRCRHLMNLSTYFLCYWLFSSALTTLLDRFYITKRRLRTHICLWILFSILSGIVLLLLPKGGLQTTVMFALGMVGYLWAVLDP